MTCLECLARKLNGRFVLVTPESLLPERLAKNMPVILTKPAPWARYGGLSDLVRGVKRATGTSTIPRGGHKNQGQARTDYLLEYLLLLAAIVITVVIVILYFVAGGR